MANTDNRRSNVQALSSKCPRLWQVLHDDVRHAHSFNRVCGIHHITRSKVQGLPLHFMFWWTALECIQHLSVLGQPSPTCDVGSIRIRDDGACMQSLLLRMRAYLYCMYLRSKIARHQTHDLCLQVP